MRRLLKALVVVVAVVLLFALEGLVDDGGHADVGVVLGNEVYADGTLSPRLRARVDHAISLYDEGRIAKILVSGAVGKSGVNEADAMAAYVRARSKVPVVVDGRGATTRLTASNSLALLGKDARVLVVSQYFHVARSRMALLQAGFDDVRASAPAYFEVRDVFSVPRDMVGFVFYALHLK